MTPVSLARLVPLSLKWRRATMPEGAPYPPGPAGDPQGLFFQTFLRELISPPAALRIGRDDRLFFRALNSATGLELAVRVRLQDANGRLSPGEQRLIPATDRSSSSGSMDLADGFLLSVTVEALAGTPRRGQCFVQVGIVHGAVGGGIFTELLISDYLTSSALIGWPGGILRSSVDGPGFLRSITGTNPAAGAEISESVPTNARWRLRGFRATLVTDATVANRRAHLILDDGTTILLDLAAADVQAASLTRNYNAGEDGFARATQDSEIYVPLPADVQLFQGWRVRTSTTAIAAGDNYAAPQLMVEEWIEE